LAIVYFLFAIGHRLSLDNKSQIENKR